MKEFIVYGEYEENGMTEKWFYGCYNERKAHEVADYENGNSNGSIWFKVIPADEAIDHGVKNLPERWA